MTTNKWNAKIVVSRLQVEYPALFDYAIQNLDHIDNITLPQSSARVLQYIISNIILPEISKRPYNAFESFDIDYQDWLTLYKKAYEWIEAKENINELVAFKML